MQEELEPPIETDLVVNAFVNGLYFDWSPLVVLTLKFTFGFGH